MSVMADVHIRMVNAMKAKDKQSKDAYSNILAALKARAKELLVDELTDEQAAQVIVKMAKQNQESIDTCPADRADIMKNLQFERGIILHYMPEQMGEAEIKTKISEVLFELGLTAPTVKDKGKIMKVLMPRVKGKADGKLVNTVLATYIK